MNAKQKQNMLIALSMFLALCSIGFSIDGSAFLWFWQRCPFVPILLLMFVFVAVRYWLVLEIEKQRQHILSEYSGKRDISVHKDLKVLLSHREIEVLQLIQAGLSNQEISDRLFISISPVKTHINNIYKILEVKSRREAIEKT